MPGVRIEEALGLHSNVHADTLSLLAAGRDNTGCLAGGSRAKSMTAYRDNHERCGMYGCCCCRLLLGCLASRQRASVSHGPICPDKCTCCHTEIEVVDEMFYLTQSQYTDTGPTSPGVIALTYNARRPGRVATVVSILSNWYDSTQKNPHGASENRTPDHTLSSLTTRPTGR